MEKNKERRRSVMEDKNGQEFKILSSRFKEKKERKDNKKVKKEDLEKQKKKEELEEVKIFKKQAGAELGRAHCQA